MVEGGPAGSFELESGRIFYVNRFKMVIIYTKVTSEIVEDQKGRAGERMAY